MAHTKKRRKYLDRSADILCKATYELCKGQLKNPPPDGKPPDAKSVKEICAAVKDVISISGSLSDEKESGEKILITLEGKAEEFAE